jgi:branched-chain amino acid transport system permease protein
MEGIVASSKRLLPFGLLCIILLLLVTMPLYVQPYLVIMLITILMYVVLTLSWTIFSGPTHYISFASAAFFGIGAYTTALVGDALPLVAVIAFGGLLSFIFALFMGFLTLRLKGVYFIIFTFGISELIRRFLLWWETTIEGTVGRFVIAVDHTTVYYVMLVIFVITLATAHLIRRSKFGLALQSIGENEEAALHIGINVISLNAITFAISSFFMGAAGAIMATRFTYIDPSIAFNLLFSFMPVLMSIFGGIDRLSGPILGATALALLEEVLITRFPYYYMIIYGAILITVILFLPNGLLGLIKKR